MLIFSLICHFYEVEKFDEKYFCQFLIQNKVLFSKLTTLKLTFTTLVTTMTGKTVCTLLEQAANLQHFENLINFNLSDNDVIKIREIAATKKLRVVSAVRSSSGDRWLSCSLNGKHAWT